MRFKSHDDIQIFNLSLSLPWNISYIGPTQTHHCFILQNYKTAEAIKSHNLNGLTCLQVKGQVQTIGLKNLTLIILAFYHINSSLCTYMIISKKEDTIDRNRTANWTIMTFEVSSPLWFLVLFHITKNSDIDALNDTSKIHPVSLINLPSFFKTI